MADPNDIPRKYTPEAASRALKSKFGISKSVSVQDILDHAVDGNLVFVHVLHDGTRQPFSPWEVEVCRNAHDQGRATKLHPYIEAAELERFGRTMKQKRKKEGLSRTQEISLYKLITIMAVGGYGYDPRATRNTATSQILNDSEQLGIKIDPDTVLKWLKIATNEIEFTPPKKS
ncbi:MAG: hypothetical protein ACREX9_23030 [Gammaproteobacteria bacterium]